MRPRPQAGYTLMEVMIALGISAIILVPLFAWIVTGINVGNDVQDRSVATQGRNFLGSFLARDVSTSQIATAGGADCSGGSGAGGTVILSTRPSGDDALTRVYSVTVNKDGTGRLWRRVCTPGSSPQSEVVLIDSVRTLPGGWATAVTCTSRPGRSDDTCGRVTVRFASGKRAVIEASATRYVGGPQ